MARLGSIRQVGTSKLVAGFIVLASSAVIGTTGIANAQTPTPTGSGYGGTTNTTNINLSLNNSNNNVIQIFINYLP